MSIPGLSGFSWISFALGIVFALFLLPWLQTKFADFKGKF